MVVVHSRTTTSMSTSTAPRALRAEEWEEIAALDFVRDAWGLEAAATDGRTGGQQLSEATYGAHFDFVSGGPGFSGDLYSLHDDAMGGPPLVLIRTREGGLVTAPYHCPRWPRECDCVACAT